MKKRSVSPSGIVNLLPLLIVFNVLLFERCENGIVCSRKRSSSHTFPRGGNLAKRSCKASLHAFLTPSQRFLRREGKGLSSAITLDTFPFGNTTRRSCLRCRCFICE